eukprot:TRINITY_DN4450_c0_g1_i1.p1 TRINITY_DN4450_c0_g1~~TRINITY_DN4450_c0_g1_i1.p1  ORF type:complete len:277 (-),score=110.13 TRINITY_DN4450_c0_g1_i1:87-917(-)
MQHQQAEPAAQQQRSSSSRQQQQQQLSTQLIRQHTGEFDTSTASRLVLRHAGVARLDGAVMAECAALTWLDLSGNRLDSVCLDALEPLLQLRHLSLASNRLSQLASLGRVSTTLEHLSLEDNLISEVSELMHVHQLVSLRRLALQTADGSLSNRVCQQPGYRQALLRHAPRCLLQLDGVYLGPPHLHLAQAHGQLVAQHSSLASLARASTHDGGAWSDELMTRGKPLPARDLAGPHSAELTAALAAAGSDLLPGAGGQQPPQQQHAPDPAHPGPPL